MSPTPPHRLGRIELELRVDDEDLGRRLLPRLSLLHGRRIAPLLERLAEELSPPGRLDRLDSVDLDLGRLPLDDLDEALPARLEAALRAELARRLAGGRAGVPLAQTARELLECFARTGALPWWADRHDPGLVGRHLHALLTADPDAWGALLAELAGDPVALARLAWHWDPDLWESLVRRDRPAGLLGDLRALEGLVAAAGGAQARTLVRQVRTLALAELGRAGPTPAVDRLPDLLGALGTAALRHLAGTPLSAQAGPRLRAAIETLVGSDGSKARPAPPAEPADLLGHFAGIDDLPRRADRQDPDLVGRHLRAPLTADPDASDTPPAELAGGPGALARLAQHGDPAPRKSPVRHDGPEGLLGDLRTLGGLIAAPTPSAALADRPLPARAAARRALAALDEIYVEDAGLVILWPFVERLFARTGLLTPERDFRDEGARTRGLALLAELAFADPAPPEYLLPLGKVLCGLSPEDPFFPDEPPTAEQLAECGVVLTAAIGHAGLPGEWSAHRFRTAFVHRPGTLSAPEGTWRLAAQGEPQDALLPRLPWSWGWVRLPWMPGPIQVDW